MVYEYYYYIIIEKMSNNEISFEIHDIIDDIVQANPVGTDFPTVNNINMYMIITQVVESLPQVTTEMSIILPWVEEFEESPSPLHRNYQSEIKINPEKYNSIDTTYTSCSICTEDFNGEDDIGVLICNHVFHSKCIIEWGHYKCECPICSHCPDEDLD